MSSPVEIAFSKACVSSVIPSPYAPNVSGQTAAETLATQSVNIDKKHIINLDFIPFI